MIRRLLLEWPCELKRPSISFFGWDEAKGWLLFFLKKKQKRVECFVCLGRASSGVLC